MKKTRNLFVLSGCEQDVEIVLNNIVFKGVTVLTNDALSEKNICEVFANNKSIVCAQIPVCSTPHLLISVINDKTATFAEDCINISLGDISGQFERIADKHNCDIGDHKSNSSGMTDAPKTSDCAYCRYLRHESNLPERTIYSSEHFFVMTTLGEFTLGYLLIIPYAHVMSNAELDFSTQKELLDVIEDLSYLLDLTYGPSSYLVWENGTGNSGRGKAKDSVVHAHTHLAPSKLTAEQIEKVSGFYFERISTEELSKYNLHSYLLVKDGANSWRISNNPNVYIPRQYIRQLIADEYGLPGEQWNWRKYPFEELMMQTYYDMTTAIRNNWDILSDRIKANTGKHL